jgi:photosystem II stability/assembly factor-like uncharacterized protein
VGGKCGAGNPSFTTIYSSTNQGATFNPVLDSGSPNIIFNHVALTDEGGGNMHIYVSTYNPNPSGPNDNGVWVSLNGGQTFNQTLNGQWPSRMVVNPHTKHVHVDYYHSDGSGGWVNDQWPPLFDIDPFNSPQYMLAPTMGGIQRSTTGGSPGNWNRVNTGIEELQVWDVTTDLSDPDRVFVGTGSGLGRTPDNGNTWDFPIPMGAGNEIQAISSIAVNPITPTIVYALQWAGGEIWRSVDGGDTWVERVLTTTAGAGGQVAIDPNNTDVVYAAWVSQGNPGDGHLYQTTNGGQSWHSAGLGGVPVNAVETVSDTNGTTVYVGVGDLFDGDPAGGVYRRRPGESSWMQVGPTNTVVHDIAVDPLDSGHLYIGVGPGVPNTPPYGIFESHDRGDSWTQLDLNPDEAGIWAIVLAPQSPDTIYAATQNRVYRSHDGGPTWNIYYEDPTFETTFNTLHIPWLPPGPNINFTAISTGINQSGIQSQANGQSGSVLYLAASSGLYSRSTGEKSVYLPIVFKQ